MNSTIQSTSHSPDESMPSEENRVEDSLISPNSDFTDTASIESPHNEVHRNSPVNTANIAYIPDRVLFTAESPYFAKSISDYGKETASLNEYLKNINKLMKQYTDGILKLSSTGEMIGDALRQVR
jgi:hypothetical protein